MLDADFLSSARPDDTLQAHPDIIIAGYAFEAASGRVEAEFDKTDPQDASAPPVGQPVFIMAATGRRWVAAGRPKVQFGDWTFRLEADTEQLVLLQEPNTLPEIGALELRVHDLLTAADAAHVPPVSTPAFRGQASRLTKWSLSPIDKRALTDSARGLLFEVIGGRPTMHWWHETPSSVFDDMDVIRRRMKSPFMRTLVTRGGSGLAAGSGKAHRARPTIFEPLDR